MSHWLMQSTNAYPALVFGDVPAGVLTQAEYERYWQLKTPKRQRDWLLGRLTAKRLLQAVLEQETGQRWPLDSLLIGTLVSGAPCLPHYPEYALSISHAPGAALCAIARGERIGVDLEAIAPRSAAFVADYLTAEEQGAVQAVSAAHRPTLVNAIWSAKEAVLKLHQVGLNVDTRAVSCTGAFPQADWQLFTMRQDARLPGVAGDLRGWWCVRDGYVLTQVLLAEHEVQPPSQAMTTPLDGQVSQQRQL